MPPSKRQRYTIGAIVKVPLGHDMHTHARLLDFPLIAFYDSKSSDDSPIETILSRPILFKLWVMKSAITSGRWLKVGSYPLEAALQVSPIFFKQDPLRPAKFSLYQDGREEPANREQCAGLERAAVWEAEHVEERLRDHYAGKPNRWVESLKLPDSV